jgi:hypothetical protein
MPTYRRDEEVVEAERFLGHPFPGVTPEEPFTDAAGRLIAGTMETSRGPIDVSPGDWIVQRPDEDPIVLKPADFAARYEPVAEDLS